MNIFQIIMKVILSWQVIVIAIVIFLFLSLISHVAKAYHSPRPKKVKPVKKKEAVPAASEGPEESFTDGGDTNDELGLEEA